MKKQVIVCAMIGVAPFFSSLASFDWSKHIEDWNGFVQNYEQCKEARRQFDSATNDIVRLTAKIAAVATEHPKSDVDLKIGEFEEMGDFQARVEQQRKQKEKLRQDKRVELEKQRQQCINEARLHLKDIKECTLRMSAFTNRLQSAHCINENALPYFDRGSMSFKDIPNPFYLESGNDWEARERKVLYSLNTNVSKTISLKFKNLPDAQKFKDGVSAGTIKMVFCCEFNVGMPAEWIIEEGHYEYEEVNEVCRFLNDVSDVLHHINYALAEANGTNYYGGGRPFKGKKVWCDTVKGIEIPVNVISSKINIKGESGESLNIEIVSPTGSWTLEKRCTRGE